MFCHSIQIKKAILGVSSTIQAQANMRELANDFPLNSSSRLTVDDFYNAKTTKEKILHVLKPFYNNFALRGTGLYWKEKQNELLSLLCSLDVVSWFHTLSNGDLFTPEVSSISLRFIFNLLLPFIHIFFSN